MPASAQSTCSTVCTFALPSAMRRRALDRLHILDAGIDHRLVRQIRALELPAMPGRRGMQREDDLLPGVERGAGYGDALGERALIETHREIAEKEAPLMGIRIHRGKRDDGTQVRTRAWAMLTGAPFLTPDQRAPGHLRGLRHAEHVQQRGGDIGEDAVVAASRARRHRRRRRCRARDWWCARCWASRRDCASARSCRGRR